MKGSPAITQDTLAASQVLALRTRTPPDLKWLLNERAALAGEVSKAELTQAGLQAKQTRLEQQLAKVQLLLARSQCAQSRAQASVNALDVTIALAYAQVEPTAGGVVDAWAGKYGKRGGLGEFIAQSLREVAPAPLTTSVLMELASHHFGITFPLAKDRRSFNKSVNSSLYWLRKRELAEAIALPTARHPWFVALESAVANNGCAARASAGLVPGVDGVE